MAICYFVLLIMIMIPLPACKRGGVHENYIESNKTLYVKGVFVILVMLSHFCGYVAITDSVFDTIFLRINYAIGQLMVAPFFFYSGYGIYESVKNKGKHYIIGFPQNRILFTWLNFSICVTLFLIEGIILGKKFDIKTILLSYTAWDSIGNSNWFMFVTFVLYGLFFVVFRFGENLNSIKRLLLFSSFALAVTGFLYLYKENWWWDTLLCFPAGMWFSRYKKQIDNYIRRYKFGWSLSFVFIIAIFGGLYYLQSRNHIVFIVYSILFSLIIVWISMKIQIRNPILSFLGKHIFGIYILQRFWYILFSICNLNRYVFLALSIFTTICSAVLFDFVMKKFKARFMHS